MRLWRYVLFEHFGPFFFGLLVITFVLIIDFIPQVLDMVVGRDIPAVVVARLFAYNLAWMMALSIPMAVLVATLMAFGRFSADNEIVALKSSGVNILRLVTPVVAAALLLGGALVWFNNEVLPESNHSARILMGNVSRKRPTLRIKENVFIGDIPGYFLLVKWRDPRGDAIRDITIYDQRDERWPRTVTAQQGQMHFTPDGGTLIMELQDGEVHEFVGEEHEYRRTQFAEQTVFLPGAGGDLPEGDSDYRTDREKSTTMMLADIRAWKANLAAYERGLDSMSHAVVATTLEPNRSLRQPALRAAETAAARLRGQIESQKRLINSMMIEVHKKYSIPTACVVFVLIGAPLGVLARRGGIGVGLGMSLGLFIVYWAFLIAGEELADRLIVNAFWAMWSANFLIGGVGMVLLAAVVRERTPQDWWRHLRYRTFIADRACTPSTAT
jgi:lipopolysaccharide export system permease protein